MAAKITLRCDACGDALVVPEGRGISPTSVRRWAREDHGWTRDTRKNHPFDRCKPCSEDKARQ